MGKFIRDNQVDKYSRNEEEFFYTKKRKKVKKFKDSDEQKDKLIKKD